MISALAIIALFLTVYLFIRDMGDQQVISSRFDSHYRLFHAETIVQHEYISKPETIWKVLTTLEDYCLWFPGINRLLPIIDSLRYVHRFSFDRFVFEPGAFIKIRPRTFLPSFNGRILEIEPNKKLEMEMRFNPVSKETISFQINLMPSGSSEVVCKRSSHGLFSFLTTWGFADRGSAILHNLADFLPDDTTDNKNEDETAIVDSGPKLSRETIIAQAVQAGLDGNMDFINAIPDKPTRGLAKAALLKAKRLGGMPENLVKALDAAPVPSSEENTPSQSTGGLPAFDNNEDLIAYVVNMALEGDMDPINNIPEKPLRGKAKAAMIKAKRTGELPPMPSIPVLAVPTPSDKQETESELIARLVDAGVAGSMDEINALDNKVLRGKIKSAVFRAKRTSK
ncbi:MAG TPA: hypothetical protein EYO79_00130 [Candidatus Marinimicrobia bacterium]|nr:hypothetical protein [Candidatus Neomarinimicrobiota bacterium]